MRIQEKVSINAYGLTGQPSVLERAGEKERSEGKSIYAGGFQGALSLQDRISQRREQAQKQAFKVVRDAWEGEKRIEEQLDECRKRIREFAKEEKSAQDNLNEIAKQSEELKATYGITDDCEEAQELELLRRKKASGRGGCSLTEEEREKCFRIEERGLTEYQMRQLELDDAAEISKEIIQNCERGIKIENAIIRGIKEERRKVHPMVDAKRREEEIMEGVSKEIVGMVVEDAREKLDEEQEKQEEKAENIREEREEQERLLEKRKEEKQELDELTEELQTEEISDLMQVQNKIKAEVEKLVNRMKLVAEDIKGAAVDTNV